jgi:hypothetical protein
LHGTATTTHATKAKIQTSEGEPPRDSQQAATHQILKHPTNRNTGRLKAYVLAICTLTPPRSTWAKTKGSSLLPLIEPRAMSV